MKDCGLDQVLWMFLLMGLVCLLIGGLKIGAFNEQDIWQADMIERGYAEYNIQTGDWGMKDEQ